MPDTDHEEPPDPRDFSDASPNLASDAELTVLGDALQERGIPRVIVRYEGCGDSGCVAEIDYTPQIESPPEWLDDALEHAAEGYCPDGYENGTGGYGSLTIYPMQGLATLEH